MRILQLIQKPQRRGAEIFAAQLGEELSKLGHQVLLVSIFEGEAELPFSGNWTKLNRPISYRFFDFKGWRRFSEIVCDFRPDLIQANAADTLKFSVFSKLLYGFNCPIFYRNANQMGDFIKGRRHRKFNQFLISQVSGVISVSESSRLNFHQNFCFPKEKSTTIPIGIDLVAIEKAVRLPIARELPLEFIAQIGGLVVEKDPLSMISIFREVQKDHPDLELVFVGSGALEQELRRKIDESSLRNSVKIIPPQTNIFPVLATAKALVLPSKIEGLPGVILEAMYCMTPVIAFNVGGIAEVLNKDTGWLLPVGDQRVFGQTICEVLSMESISKEKVLSSARQEIETNYSIYEVAKTFDTYFRTVI